MIVLKKMKKIVFLMTIIKLIYSNELKEEEHCETNNKKKEENYIINEKKKKEKYIKEENDISLCMVGDILMHRNLTNYGYDSKRDTYNFDFMFENMEKYIKEYDMKIVNEEVLIAGRKFGITDFPKFNSPFELADSIVKAGFNIILKATNHINDKGLEAIKSDLNNWKKKYPNITITGSYLNEEDYNKITYYNKNNIKIALLNYCYGSNVKLEKNYTMNELKYEKIKSDIEKAKKEGAEFIIVFPHWGKEYVLKEIKYQEYYTKIFFNLGVDLVIGTHPHVIQPLKLYYNKQSNRKMYVFYSIGNFINATALRGKNIFWRFLGGMAHVIIGRDKSNKVVVKDIKFIPLITHIFENKKISTFKVKDYNRTMAQNSFVGKEFDNTFSYDNMINIFNTVINSQYLDFEL